MERLATGSNGLLSWRNFFIVSFHLKKMFEKFRRSLTVIHFLWYQIAYDTVASSGEYFTSCSFDKWPAQGKVCNFDIKLLGTQCTKEELFGYERGRPCIVLKLNRIFGWIPEPYDDPSELPANMPTELKEYIKTKATENKEQVRSNNTQFQTFFFFF
jgi:hypothetical protein